MAAPGGQANRVQVTDLGGKVRIEIRDELFAEYHYKDVPRPYLYPILCPGRVEMTRSWPMKEVEGEDRDHKQDRKSVV